MNATILKALKGSIKKWEGVVRGTVIDYGASNCPLCKLFYFKKDCTGCPVRKKTGHEACRKSPFVNWRMRVIGAQEELDFLKSLLPRKHRAKK